MMHEDDLVSIIKGHVEQGLGSDLGDLSQDREEVFDRYVGELYGNEVDGESKVTTRDVLETIEWALPALLRHFAGNEQPVEFEPDSAADVLPAQLETAAVRQQFFKDNPGFTILYLMFKTVMMNPNGYVKVWREETDRVVFEHYRNITLEEVTMIEDDPDLELIESEEQELDEDLEDNPIAVAEAEIEPLWNIKVKRKLTQGRNLVMVLPEDEVVVDSDWQQLDLDECPFVCHYPDKTQSELIQMGVDEDLLDEIYGSGSEADSSEETNRRNYSDETFADDETHKALRKFRYHECSMLVDFDEDGIAERRRVIMINDHIWENEEDDEQTIISGGSILMPHKHIQMSLAQTILDLQEIHTTVMRQTFNNMYRMNNPRTIVTKGANMADVLANRTNGVLRAKSKDDISIEETRPIIGQVVPLIELINSMKEMRTGITRQSSVPDPNTIRDSAQGSFLAMIEKADQRIDLLARVFGETIVKKIYIKLHGLIKRNGDLSDVRVNGQWVQTDPTTWRRRENVTCRVGLGHTSKQARLVAAQTITNDHNLLIEKGAIADPQKGVKGLVSWSNIYEGRKLMVEALGEEPSRFYTNPDLIQEQPKQPAPDINLLMIQSNERIEQGKLQSAYVKLQQEGAMQQMKLQAEYAFKERQLRFQETEAAYKAQIDRLKAEVSAAESAGKGETDQLKLEILSLSEQLKDAQNDEKLAVDKYKADLASQTQITLKQMELGVEKIEKLEQIDHLANANLPEANEELRAMLTQQQTEVSTALNALAAMITEMRQPKEIAYDDDGEIIGIRNPATGEVKPVKRDAKGNIIGKG